MQIGAAINLASKDLVTPDMPTVLADAVGRRVREARQASSEAVHGRARLNGDTIRWLMPAGPGRFAEFANALGWEATHRLTVLVVGMLVAAGSAWLAFLLVNGAFPDGGPATARLGLAALFLVVGAGMAKASLLPRDRLLTGVGDAMAVAGHDVMGVGDGRIYLASGRKDGPVHIREIHFDALGSAHVQGGDLVIYDRAGLPLATLRDPITWQGSGSVDAAAYLRSRFGVRGSPVVTPPAQDERSPQLPKARMTVPRISLLVLAVAAPWVVPATATPSDCASLPSSTQDQRNRRRLCRAIAEAKPSECASIVGDTDLRRLCEAQAKGDPGPCASISDSASRAYCRGVSGGRR